MEYSEARDPRMDPGGYFLGNHVDGAVQYSEASGTPQQGQPAGTIALPYPGAPAQPTFEDVYEGSAGMRSIHGAPQGSGPATLVKYDNEANTLRTNATQAAGGLTRSRQFQQVIPLPV